MNCINKVLTRCARCSSVGDPLNVNVIYFFQQNQVNQAIYATKGGLMAPNFNHFPQTYFNVSGNLLVFVILPY